MHRHQLTRTAPARRNRRRSLVAAGALAATTIVVPAVGGDTVTAADTIVFDDMEHGDPGANGWFSFGGDVGGGGIAANPTDLPPVDGGVYSLETGWGSGGNPGYYGGFGRTNPVDLSGTTSFEFWINPDPGQDYTLQINLQDDDNGDGAISQAEDDEFQFDCVIGAAGPCALAGGGWQHVSIPLADFFDDGSYLYGGNGVLDPVAVANGGNGELINVVVAVIGTGSDVNFRTDNWVFAADTVEPPGDTQLVTGFEDGVAPGTPCAPAAPPLGFCTFAGAGSSITLSNPATPPAPELPAVGTPNHVLQLDLDVGSYAGFIHGFESGGEWVGQDWSTREGISFWLYGTGSGTDMFLDLLDNRNPASTTDDAERYTATFADDVAGWHQRQFPFSSFARKEVGNGAPNDGLTLFDVHGWALGTLGTGGPLTVYVDQVELYGEAAPPALAVRLSTQQTFVDEGTTGQVGVRLSRPMGPNDPAQVSIDYATERSTARPGEEFTPTSGTLTFVNGGPSEQFFQVETFDDTKFEGVEQIVVRLTNPVDVERGTPFQGSVLIDDDDPFDPLVLDDFTQGVGLWDTQGAADIEHVRVAAGDPMARPEQDSVEDMAVLSVPTAVDVIVRGDACRSTAGVVPVELLSTDDFDATSVDPASDTFGGASEVHVDRRTGEPRRHLEDVNGDGLTDAVFHFDVTAIDGACDGTASLQGSTFDGRPVTTGGSDAALTHDFALGQDWTGTESLSFWYLGAGGGEDVVVTLKDNRAPDPGPSGWTLAWSDEFDDAAGTAPDPANWAYEIGDTTPDGTNGWGNDELQYYTDDPEHAQTDGNGNLAIVLDEADEGLECYYGPCQFESARLITLNRAEFAYGRYESRLKVPTGGAGLWPAFWGLGTDITYNSWPAAGEIDIMEYVSRLPEEIFGTVHGPGYSGGASIGDVYDFGVPVYEADRADGAPDDGYHTFAVEWEPESITWYVDDVEYHHVTPADVTGQWVFDKPFYLLLNFAAGGNFGGAVDPDNTYPQEYLVDYVRVYQGPDTAERFETSFVDDVAGWRQVTIPMTDFVRSADQPAGAPDDGLTLGEVWGYGFEFPNGTATGSAGLDLVRRVEFPPPTELVVTNLDDAGPGSLRASLAEIADGGTIGFDPALVGGTIPLESELVVDRSVTIDASAAPGIVLSGQGATRVLRVVAGVDVALNDLVVADGAASPQGGGIHNSGTLSLDHVVVRDNTVTTPAPADYQFGGGGIYNGADAVLTLTDSTVADNTSLAQPGGGVYGFFGSSIAIIRSTISGNVSGDVAGGLRTLGDVVIDNSTISGNVSTTWHGGAAFLTDGTVAISHTTIVGNTAPGGTAGGLMVATFGAPVTVTLADNLIADNGTYNCQVEGGAAAVLASLGGNVVTDGSCAAGAADDIVTPGSAGVAPLADNGGPTLTHALLTGSPAIDASVVGCPATDQRGVPRPSGGACDSGSYEFTD